MNLLAVNPERFWNKVDKSGECWVWTGSMRSTGYGFARVPGPKKTGTSAHRVAYVLAGKTIPDGYQVDHLCKNPSCVRPDHLEAVTSRENWLRSSAVSRVNLAKTHCKHGHELVGANLRLTKKGFRVCVECHAKTLRDWRASHRDDRPPRPRSAKTHCPQGHPYDAENTYVARSGGRSCKECSRTQTREWRARQRVIAMLEADAQNATEPGEAS